MIEEIKKYDKDFNLALFYTKIDHVFIMILAAIIENDLSSVKHYLSKDLYKKFNTMIDKYKKDHLTRIFDEMNIKSSLITDYEVKNNKLTINVEIISRYMDYFVNEDGDYVSGNNAHRTEMSHKIAFTKNLDAKKLDEVRRCPSCGHSLDINASGLCKFCGETIDMSKYDYIVTEITNI